MRSKLLFIHIPKTGGTSIAKYLLESGLDKWNRDFNYKHHDPLILLEKNNLIDIDTFKFSVVRNPYTRTYSYYHHFMRINSISLSFTDFLDIIKKEIFFPQTPLINKLQKYYVLDKSGGIGLTKIYNYENLLELESDLNFKLEKLNVGNYSKKEYYDDYNKKNINLVKEIFFDDFKIFNYSLDFS
jgi:hypothetical protein